MTDLHNDGRGGGVETALGLSERLACWLVAIPVIVMISMWPLSRPQVVDASAPASEFSTERAFVHLENFARAPHPMGSPEHARVREYLVDQIESLGVEAVVQTDTLIDNYEGGNQVARIRNVLARLKGSGSGRAVLLMAHYDTVPHSPGASDDGAGVAALLETLRALSQGPTLKNDVIFLFSDGEERQLLGAKAFHRFHPWAADVAMVLNFEARGADGPSIMFETGPGTGPRIGQFGRFTPRPLAYSYSEDVYRYLPNDTDFTVFKRAGTPGFNFAYIHDVGAYHSSVDTVERIAPRSLQHHGSHALALARGFGDADLTTTGDSGGAVYFSLPLVGLVSYSTALVLPLAVLLVVLAVLYFISARGRLAFGRVALSMLAYLGIVAAVVLITTLIHRGLLAVLISNRGFLPQPPIYRLGLVLVAVAVAVALFGLLGRKLGALNLSTGAMIWWLILALAAAVVLPASSYLLAWPLLFCLVALLVLVRGTADGPASKATAALLLVLMIPALFIWAPTVSLVGAAFGTGAAALLAGFVALLAGATGPQLAVWATGNGRALPAVLLTLGLVLALWQAAGTHFDAEQPQENSVFYGMDTESQTAVWASFDGEIDDWMSQFLPPDTERRTIPNFFNLQDIELLAADAPLAALPAPVARLANDDAASDDAGSDETVADAPGDEPAAAEPLDAGQRQLSLHVGSARRASALMVRLRSDSPISSLTIDGHAADVGRVTRPDDAPQGYWHAMFYGASPDGFTLDIELDGPDPLTVTVVDRVYQLPQVDGTNWTPRPEGMMPALYRPTDMSLVRKVFVF